MMTILKAHSDLIKLIICLTNSSKPDDVQFTIKELNTSSQFRVWIL